MKEWYLMNDAHNMVSGFESEDFDAFAKDGFTEALESSMGKTVELCSPDLAKREKIRVIVEGSVQDTRLNALQRKFLTKIGTIHAGEYIFYNGRYWLIIGLVDDNGLYEKGVAILCNYYLTWMNDSGKVVQRWCSISSASQYNNGETSTEYIFSRTDQLMVLLPQDDECLLIPHKKRFVIDLRTSIYEKSIPARTMMDKSHDLLTYELTRTDNVLFNYVDSGHFEFMAYQDEQHPEDGYYTVDGSGYWLCEAPKAEESKPKGAEILCDEAVVYCGVGPSVFLAKFHDENGEHEENTSAVPQWAVRSAFDSDLVVEQAGHSIYISTSNRKLIGKTFELVLAADEYQESSLTVRISSFL